MADPRDDGGHLVAEALIQQPIPRTCQGKDCRRAPAVCLRRDVEESAHFFCEGCSTREINQWNEGHN